MLLLQIHTSSCVLGCSSYPPPLGPLRCRPLRYLGTRCVMDDTRRHISNDIYLGLVAQFGPYRVLNVRLQVLNLCPEHIVLPCREDHRQTFLVPSRSLVHDPIEPNRSLSMTTDISQAYPGNHIMLEGCVCSHVMSFHLTNQCDCIILSAILCVKFTAKLRCAS